MICENLLLFDNLIFANFKKIANYFYFPLIEMINDNLFFKRIKYNNTKLKIYIEKSTKTFNKLIIYPVIINGRRHINNIFILFFTLVSFSI